MWYRYSNTSKDLYHSYVNEKVRKVSEENNWEIPVGLRTPDPGFDPAGRTPFADQLEKQFGKLHDELGGPEGAKNAMVDWLKGRKEEVKSFNPHSNAPGNPEFSRAFYLLPDGSLTAAAGSHRMLDRDLLSEFNINPHFVEDGDRVISNLVGAVSLLLRGPGKFEAIVRYSPTPEQTGWLSEHMKPGAEPFVSVITSLNAADRRFDSYTKVPQLLLNMNNMMPQSEANPSLKAIRPGLYNSNALWS